MKAVKENQYITYRGPLIWIITDFSSENTGVKRHAKYVSKYKWLSPVFLLQISFWKQVKQ